MRAPRFLVVALAGLYPWMAPSQVLPSRSRSAGADVTFNRQIVRILQQNCQTCHHPGDIGPRSEERRVGKECRL